VFKSRKEGAEFFLFEADRDPEGEPVRKEYFQFLFPKFRKTRF